MTPEVDLLSRLSRLDTPTVCNAIEVAQGKRGFAAFTRTAPVSSDAVSRDPANGAGAPEAVVGYARTARIRGRRPPDEAPEVVRGTRMAYYRYMSEGERPAVAVIEDIDYPECVGAFWGEVNAVVHRGFGLAGALTNGVLRDLGDLPDGFPIVAGSIGVSHGFVHVLDVDVPVSVLGLDVAPGNLVHADRHGAVVIPPDVVPELGTALDRLIAMERLVLEPALRDGFDFEAFERSWTEFEKARV